MTPTTRANPSQHSVTAAGERIGQQQLVTEWELAPIQRALMNAREKYSYALCGCRPESLKLQIRLRAGKLHLAVWPDEGPKHDTLCMFFRDELVESPAHGRQSQAADESSTSRTKPPAPAVPFLGGKRTALQLASRTAPAAAGVEVLNVRGLLMRLWDAASLCRWHPNWTRDWGRARHELLKAVSGFTLNGQPAESAVFAPRPYREALQEQLNAEWDFFVDAVGRRRDGELRVLIAPVRGFTPGSPEDAQILLRHLRVPLGLSTACAEFLRRECRNALSNSRLAADDGGQRPELVGIFSVERGRGSHPVVARAGWLMGVHPGTYMPAQNEYTVMLVDALLAGRYAFEFIASDAPPSQRSAPDWLVRHVRGPDGSTVTRAALEVLDRGAAPAFREARSRIAEHMAAHGVPTWTWVPQGRRGERRVPPLPPPDFQHAAEAARVLHELQQMPCADYALGASPKFHQPQRTNA
ncbi:DUF1173 family protein [Ramlibacter albus]|uniref:DUF1173 family protein n=1 Tax=Ramlibacter albus TaxID=2079448 RepID=A0A923MBE9_9BURK|nr:DUF1173 family protein [Ramlibacter albus]MBC5767550.1 DUF1173 family protein [Ramlibacter albus]